MANFFNFYPADGSATIAEIPASEVAKVLADNVAADDFGCLEANGGLYVPTISDAELQDRIIGYKLVNANFRACLEICGVDLTRPLKPNLAHL